jgi:DNA-binding ferritin-like protein
MSAQKCPHLRIRQGRNRLCRRLVDGFVQHEQALLMEVPQGEMDTCDDGGVAQLVKHLVMLASLLKELQTQSHLIHLNYEGANFLEVHAFLKERYKEHLKQFDTVAEEVRSLDHFMPMCACGLKEAMPPFQNVENYDGRSMLLAYYVNIESMGYLAKEIEQVAAAVGAPDVQNTMAELVGSAFRTSWMLKSILRGC